MAPRSGQKSSTPLGRGCGCFGMGVVVGVLILPMSIFLLFTVPSVQRLLGQSLSTMLRGRIQQTYQRLTTPPPPPREQGAGETRAVTQGEYSHLLTYDGLRIRYRVTSPADGREPSVHGEVENTGKRTVRVLRLYMNIPRLDSDGTVTEYHTEDFEVLRDTVRAEADELTPGGRKNFLLHPASAPSGWTPDRVRLKVKDVEYLN